VPDPEEIAALITPRTRAIVVVNPNNPTGAVYPRKVLEAIAALAERRGLVVFSDEIYDQILYDGAQFVPMATLVHDTLRVTTAGLSKVYRACGYRVGWAVMSGKVSAAGEFFEAMELLASLRLCSNVAGQWAVQTALGGVSKYLRAHRAGRSSVRITPRDRREYGGKSALQAQDSARRVVRLRWVSTVINCPSSTIKRSRSNCSSASTCWLHRASASTSRTVHHFRITNLPDAVTLKTVFARMGELLAEYAARPATANTVVQAVGRFRN
jgi:alanine-synthesizing transaminase